MPWSPAFWLKMGCWLPCCCCCGGGCWCFGIGGGRVAPESAGLRTNLKISKESGFSGVAAEMPKLFPAGKTTWLAVRTRIVTSIVGLRIIHLVGFEAKLIVNSDLENRVRMLDPNNRRTAKVPVRIVTMAKSQAINAAMTLVVRRSVVQKASNTSTLDDGQFPLRK